jgi:hypothetical protein
VHKKTLRAIALRVAYHLPQKLVELPGHPLNTLVGRFLSDLPGSLHEKVTRMSRFLCHSRFEVTEAFHQVARGIIETVAHCSPKSRILIALDWTDLGKFMGLWLSLPYHGRALPLSCAVIEKTTSENARTDMELDLIRGFLGLFPPEIRSRIIVLADRGFAKRERFEAIEDLGTHRMTTTPGTWPAASLKSGTSWTGTPGGSRSRRCSAWRSKVDRKRFVKGSAWGGLSVFRIAEACFWSCLPEAPEQVEAAIVARWTLRRAA